MEDQKLEMFFYKERWKELIDSCDAKGIDKTLLRKLCEPEYRVNLYDCIVMGKYKIYPPHVGRIPKDNGEYREVYINEDLDRVVLSQINAVYSELYKEKIHPYCVSYKRGIGVQKVILSVCDKLKKMDPSDCHGYKIDLQKYFDSVKIEYVNAALESLSTGSPLDAILKEYYNEDLVFDYMGELCEHYKSLAQGCAFGSFLANYVLYDIDNLICSMDVIYYRYSDDILIIGREADKAMNKLKELLEERSLKMNPKKVLKISVGDTFTFLGFDLVTDGKTIDLSKSSIAKIKAEVKSITEKYMKSSYCSTVRLCKAVKGIQYKLYEAIEKNGKSFGWAVYKLGICTNLSTIQMLDEYCKDHLKMVFTKKKNHTHNRRKCSNDMLRECGYKSLVLMYKALITDRAAYNTLVNQML